jgi:nucleoid DNA-binding protein
MTEKTSFSELISKISGRVDKSQDFTQDFMRELVSIIESGLKTSGSVSISGFGKFELRWMKERKGINPQTGEEITITGQNKVVFKPFKTLREHVNRPYARMKPQVLEESPDTINESTSRAAPPPVKPPDEKISHDTEKDFEDGKPTPGDTDNKSPLIWDRERPVEPAPDTIRGRDEAAPFPFFIEDDDEISEPEPWETLEDLLIIRESPVKKDTIAVGFEGSDMVKKVQGEGTFRWSYIAAVIAAFLIILAVYYVLSERQEPDLIPQETPVTEVEPDPATETEPPAEPDLVIEETEPSDIEETEFIAIMIATGQNLWNLAIEYLGDPYLWPWIYYLNSDVIEDPNLVYSGTDLTIRIPNDGDNLTNSELQEIAYGYIHVYHWFKENEQDNARDFLWAAGLYNMSVLDELEGQIDPADLRFARNR